MTDLTQDELTVLMIAAQGESMMPIGRWEKPVESLVSRGYLKALDKFNNVITAAGRGAIEKDEGETTRALIGTHNAVVEGQQKTRETASQIAVQLVDLAEMTARITGEDKVEVLRKWAKTILETALERLR